jgi:hypothetical protein
MTEFEKFDAVVRKIFSVSHDDIVKREKEYQRRRKLERQKRQLVKERKANDDAAKSRAH